MRPILALCPAVLTVSHPPVFAVAGTAQPPGALRIGLDHSFRHSTTFCCFPVDRVFTLSDPHLPAVALAHGASNAIYKAHRHAEGHHSGAGGVPSKILPMAEGKAALTALPGGGAALSRSPGWTAGLSARQDCPWKRYRGFLTVRRDPDNTLRVSQHRAIGAVSVWSHPSGDRRECPDGSHESAGGGRADLCAEKPGQVCRWTGLISMTRPAARDITEWMGRRQGPMPPWTERAGRC